MKKTAQYPQLIINNQPSAKKADSRKLKTESFQRGITALAVLIILGFFLAVSLALVGTGTIKLPGGANLAVSPIPISDPVEDDEACDDPSDAECELDLENDPEDLTPAQIKRALEEE